MRLVRFIALCGAASRRGAADLVREGLVAVNGEVTLNLALDVSETDRLTLRGQPLSPLPETATYLLHKPAGCICSLRDPHNAETVLDCFPPTLRPGLKPVGRLDKDTTGVLLLTGDGDLAFRLTHPRYGAQKTYEAEVTGEVSEEALHRLRNGVPLEDGPTAPAVVTDCGFDPRTRRTLLELQIHEGRNRQVRRMCEAVGHRVCRLRRTRFATLTLRGLAPGAYRALTAAEVDKLRHLVGLKPLRPEKSTQ